jgi:hypothetical protein
MELFADTVEIGSMGDLRVSPRDCTNPPGNSQGKSNSPLAE